MYHLTPQYKECHDVYKRNHGRRHYPSYIKDIETFLAGYSSFVEAYNSQTMIHGASDNRLIKSRIADKANNQGKSGGYRILLLCIPNKGEDGEIMQPIDGCVYLLAIFPKKGSLGQANISDDKIADAVAKAMTDIAEGNCVKITKPLKDH